VHGRHLFRGSADRRVAITTNWQEYRIPFGCFGNGMVFDGYFTNMLFMHSARTRVSRSTRSATIEVRRRRGLFGAPVVMTPQVEGPVRR